MEAGHGRLKAGASQKTEGMHTLAEEVALAAPWVREWEGVEAEPLAELGPAAAQSAWR